MKLVGIVYGKEALMWAYQAKRAGAELIEVRLDLFDNYSIEIFKELLIKIRNKIQLPIIATLRDKKEGGKCDIEKSKRVEIIKSITDLVDYIDIELNFGKLLNELVEFIHKRGKKVILSYHNFNNTPANKRLYEIAERAKNKSADIIKIITYARDKNDVVRLLIFTHNWRYKPLITFSMGEKGTISRIVSPLFGSVFSYGYIKDKVAPSQLSLTELKYIFSIVYP